MVCLPPLDTPSLRIRNWSLSSHWSILHRQRDIHRHLLTWETYEFFGPFQWWSKVWNYRHAFYFPAVLACSSILPVSNVQSDSRTIRRCCPQRKAWYLLVVDVVVAAFLGAPTFFWLTFVVVAAVVLACSWLCLLCWTAAVVVPSTRALPVASRSFYWVWVCCCGCYLLWFLWLLPPTVLRSVVRSPFRQYVSARIEWCQSLVAIVFPGHQCLFGWWCVRVGMTRVSRMLMSRNCY